MNKLLTIIQNQTRQLFVASVLVAVLLAPILSSGSSKAAGTDVLSLSPSSGSYNSLSTFTVSIYATTASNSGHNIAGAEADLLFNASQLEYISSSTAGSAFSQFVGPTVTPTVTPDEFTLAGAIGGAGVSGTNLIGTVTFKTLTGSGTAAITFGSQTSIYSPDLSSTWNGDTSAASYTLTTPASPPPTTPPPTTPPPSNPAPSNPAPSGSTGPSSTARTTASAPSSAPKSTPLAVPPTAAPTSSNPAPVISGITVSGLTTRSATVSWKTSIAATSVVKYGFNNQYGLTTQSSTMTTTHQVTLSSSNLSPATSYQYVVESVSAGGVGATSAAQSFTTLGFPVTIRVVDANGKVVAGARVTIDGQSQTSNSQGFASFQNMPSGALKVTIKIGDQTTTRTITVSGTVSVSGSTPLQQFSLSAVRGSTNPLYYIITIILVVMVAGVAILRPRNRLHNFAMATADATFPTTSDPDLGVAAVVTPQSSSSEPSGIAQDEEPAADSESVGPVNVSDLHPKNATHEPGQVISPDPENAAAEPTEPDDPTDGPPDNKIPQD